MKYLRWSLAAAAVALAIGGALLIAFNLEIEPVYAPGAFGLSFRVWFYSW